MRRLGVKVGGRHSFGDGEVLASKGDKIYNFLLAKFGNYTAIFGNLGINTMRVNTTTSTLPFDIKFTPIS